MCEVWNIANQKRRNTGWRGGRGRSGLLSLGTWHVTNEDSLVGGEEQVGELGNVARHKRGLTRWRGGRKEEWVSELGNMARHKQGHTSWRGGRGRSARAGW